MLEFLKRAGAKIKKVATACWGYTKAWGLSYVALTQLASGAGQTLFVVPRFVKYWIGKEEYPYSTPVTVGISIGTVLTLLSSRTENIFHQFGDDAGVEEEIEVKTRTGKVFVFTASALAFINGLFGSLGNYLFAITLMEQITDSILQRPTTEKSQEEFNAMTAVQLVALSFYLSKFIANLAFTQRRVRFNARKFARHVEQSHSAKEFFDFDKRAFAISAVGTLIGGIPLPYFAYFSTNNSLLRIHHISIPENVNHILSVISAPLAAEVYLLTGPFTLYNLLKKEKARPATPCWEIPVDVIVYSGMAIDCGSTVISNFTGFTSTSEKALGLDPNNTYVRIAAGLTSTSSALLNTFLNREGYKDSLARLVKRFQRDEYAPVSQSPEDHLASSPESSPKIEFLDDDAPVAAETPTAPVNIPRSRTSVNVSIAKHHASLLTPPPHIHIEVRVGSQEEVIIDVDGTPKQSASV